jgi:hypothetical protein
MADKMKSRVGQGVDERLQKADERLHPYDRSKRLIR